MSSKVPLLSDQILVAVEECSASERKVARTVLAAYPVAGLESVGELAARAGVSGPSVLRFISRLGFESYRDFQRSLLDEVQDRFSSEGNGSSKRISAAVGQSLDTAALRRSLDVTFKNVSGQKLQAVLDLLADPKRRIICLGGSFSHVLASYLYIHLRLLRPAVSLLGSGLNHSIEEVVDATPRDVLVVFDYRAYQQDTIELARAAADRKATIVVFTDPGLSPIADFADHILVSEVEAILEFESFVPAMAVVEALLASLEVRLGDRVRTRFEAMDELRTSIGVSPSNSVEGNGDKKRRKAQSK